MPKRFKLQSFQVGGLLGSLWDWIQMNMWRSDGVVFDVCVCVASLFKPWFAAVWLHDVSLSLSNKLLLHFTVNMKLMSNLETDISEGCIVPFSFLCYFRWYLSSSFIQLKWLCVNRVNRRMGAVKGVLSSLALRLFCLTFTFRVFSLSLLLCWFILGASCKAVQEHLHQLAEWGSFPSSPHKPVL